MLSTGEKLSKRPPFIFRAHQPLRSPNKNFQFKPISEMERIDDEFKKREMFETDAFDRDLLLKKDLHRSTVKNRWLSPKGFEPVRRKLDETVKPASTRASVNRNLAIEPYEDPRLDPGFVRSTKAYLREAHLHTVKKEIFERNNTTQFDHNASKAMTSRSTHINKSLDGRSKNLEAGDQMDAQAMQALGAL